MTCSSFLNPTHNWLASIPDSFGYWLSGLTDGEGCFIVNRTGRSYRPQFVIALRDDDSSILEKCRNVTGLGCLYPGRRNTFGDRKSKPQIYWAVYSKADTQKLSQFFQRYPLRAKKSRDFVIWKKVVDLTKLVRHSGKGSYYKPENDVIWQQMKKLKDQLEAGRKYQNHV